MIAEDCKSNKHSPFLHFELHGREDGIFLTSDEFVVWDELKKLLSVINTVSKLNLLVLMAACKGAHIINVVKPDDRAPLWGFIGPSKDVWDFDLQEAYERFYNEFFSS